MQMKAPILTTSCSVSSFSGVLRTAIGGSAAVFLAVVAASIGAAPVAEASPSHKAADGDADSNALARLYGTWSAEDVELTEGEVDIQVTFRKSGPVTILAWSEIPFVGKVRDKSAPFEVEGHFLKSEALRGGTSLRYSFKSDDELVIEYEDAKTITFHRKG